MVLNWHKQVEHRLDKQPTHLIMRNRRSIVTSPLETLNVTLLFVIIISQDPPECREDLCDSLGGDCCAPGDEYAACRDDNG